MRTKKQISLFFAILVLLFIGIAALMNFQSRRSGSLFEQASGLQLGPDSGEDDPQAYRLGDVPYEETRQFTGPPPPKKVRGYVKGG